MEQRGHDMSKSLRGNPGYEILGGGMDSAFLGSVDGADMFSLPHHSPEDGAEKLRTQPERSRQAPYSFTQGRQARGPEEQFEDGRTLPELAGARQTLPSIQSAHSFGGTPGGSAFQKQHGERKAQAASAYSSKLAPGASGKVPRPIASQRIAEARVRLAAMGGQSTAPKRSFIAENKRKAGQARGTQSTHQGIRGSSQNGSQMGSRYQGQSESSMIKSNNYTNTQSNTKAGAPYRKKLSSQLRFTHLTQKNLKTFSQDFGNSSQISGRSLRSQKSARSIRSAFSTKSRRSTTSKPEPHLPDRFSELYGQNAKKKPTRPRSSHGFAGTTTTMKKFEQLDAMMNQSMAALKEEVQNLKVEDYVAGSQSLRGLDQRGKDVTTRDMPIRILDSIIDQEEQGNNGFSLYNRGQSLKKSLIDPDRVKAFIDQQEREKAQQRLLGGNKNKENKDQARRAPRDRANERLKTKTTTQNDPAWSNMMDFFKANPAALMDALPTPPGSDLGDDGNALGATAGRKEMDFSMKPGNGGAKKYNPNTSQMSGRSIGSNRSALSLRSNTSTNSRLKAGQSIFQQNNRRAAGLYGVGKQASRGDGARGLSKRNQIQYQRPPSSGSSRMGQPGYGQRDTAYADHRAGSRRTGSVRSSGYGPARLGAGGAPGSQATKKQIPSKFLLSQSKPNQTASSIKVLGSRGADNRGLARLTSTPSTGKQNLTTTNFGVSTAGSGVMASTSTIPRARSRPAVGSSFTTKRQGSAAGAATASMGAKTFYKQHEQDALLGRQHMRRQKTTNPRYGHLSSQASAGPASGNSSFLPSIACQAGRPNIDAFGGAGLAGSRASASMSSSNTHGKKLQLKEFIKIDWSSSSIFEDYVIAQNDRYFKFRDQSHGTLTQAQISAIDQIQITISNKNMVAQQIKATAQILFQELLPSSIALQGPSDKDLGQMELQKFYQIGNMSQIETLNKQLDKLQKLFRVRAELISVLASIQSCLEMNGDIQQCFVDLDAASPEQAAADQATILRKIKIYQKASSISLQQVERFCQLYNKSTEKVKLGKFIFGKKEYKESVSQALEDLSQQCETHFNYEIQQ